MNSLAELQQLFQNYLLSGKPEIENAVMHTENIATQTRLAVYRNAYSARLVDALAENFPNLRIYLGDDVFHDLCFAYMAAHPSLYRSIRWYGDEMSSFIRQHYQNEFHYLAELAEFEWHMTLTFDASDAPIFPIEKMAEIPVESWGSLTLEFHPALIRMNFAWNVVALWESLETDETHDALHHSDHNVPWVMWRVDYSNRFYELSADEAWAIDAVRLGHNFGELCEGLCQWHDETDVGLRAATLLKGWILSGMITNINLTR